MPSDKFPPASVNLESQSNIKLDYQAFVSTNQTQTVFDILTDSVTDSVNYQIRNFFALARRRNDMKLFHIENAQFGLIRGDMMRY